MALRRSHVIWSVALIGLSFGGGAQAQSAEALVRRQRLLDQLDDAHRAGRHLDALRLAVEAGDIRMSPSVRMYIAEEHDALGHLTEGHEAAQLCVREANETAVVNNRERIVERCRRLVDDIEARSGVVTVRVRDRSSPGLRVTLGSLELTPEQLGQPQYVLTGSVRVEVVADGGRSFVQTLPVTSRSRHDVDAIFPADGDSGDASRILGRPTESAAWPWVLIGTGVALGASAVLIYAIPYHDALDTVNYYCPSNRCTSAMRLSSATVANDRVNVLGPVTWALVGAGATAVSAGLLWLLVRRSPGHEAGTPRVSAAIEVHSHGGSVMVGGTL